MGGDLPPRIAYWTSGYAPKMEAISGQVALLRRHFPHSVAWGMNPQKTCQLSWRHGLVVHPKLWLPFRGLTGVLQYGFHLNHICGGLGDWHYLKAVRTRPTVMTVAVKSVATDPALLEKVDRFIVEWHRDLAWLEGHGISPRRVTVIAPPVDPDRFRVTPMPADPFRVLFASSPDSVSGLEERGVDAILDAAALRPDYRFVLLWRPWGDSLDELRVWIRDRGLVNVEVVAKAVSRMEEVYSSVHVTIAPFRNVANTKTMPNSLLESLSCGRPIIMTAGVSIAEDVEKVLAGRIAPASGAALANALDEVREAWPSMSKAAVEFANTHFDESRFVAEHNRLYSELMR